MADRERKVEVVIEGDERDGIRAMDNIESRGGRLGRAFGGIGTAAAVGLGGIVVGAGLAGAALFSIGSEMDGAKDSIAIATGAVDAELDNLTDSFKTVFASIPTDSESAAAAIGTLNSRLGLTGVELEGRATQFLELSRITGTDLATNIESVTRVFGDWGIAAGDQAATMDELFRASQATGTGVDQLAAGVVQFGAPLRQLGFGFEESIAMLGQFEAQGVNTELVMGGMRQSLGRMARAGEDPIETFGRVTDEIKAAGSAGEANALALELFGARAGPDMAAAIREGRFEIGNLLGDIKDGESTITGAAADTNDLGESWTIFTNKAKVALEPLATALFDKLGNALEFVMPYLEQAVEWLADLGEVIDKDGIGAGLSKIGDAFRDAWPGIKAQLGEWATSLALWWVEAWPGIRTKLGELLTAFGEWVVEMAPVVAEKLVAWGSALVEWVLPQIPPLLEKLGNLLSTVGQWVLDEGLPLLVENLKTWGASFAGWLGENAGPYLQQLGTLLLRLGEWIVTDAAPAIREKLLEWSAAFISWVATDVIPQIPGKLWELANVIGAWLRDEAAPWVAERALKIGVDLIGAIRDGAVDGVGWLMDVIGKIPGMVTRWFSGAIGWLAQAGRDVIQGLWDGIQEKWGQMTSWVGDKVAELQDKITRPWEIFSPSHFTQRIGRHITDGLALGLAEGFDEDVYPTVEGAAGRLATALSSSSSTATQHGPSATFSSSSSSATRASSSSGGRTTGAPVVIQLVMPNGRVLAEESIPHLRVIGEESYAIPDR